MSSDWNAAEILKGLEDVRERTSANWRNGLNRRTLIIVSALVVPLIVVYAFAARPPVFFPTEEIITIEEGSTLVEIADLLYKKQIILSPTTFRFALTAIAGDSGAVAGDYQFKKPLNVISIARRVGSGAFGLTPTRITVAEGATVADMKIIFGKRLPRFDAEKFEQEALALEGYLFPDTYFFLPTATEETVMRAMLDNFESHVREIERFRIVLGKPLEDVVIMASLLEKEAKDFEEKRGIAGVLWNRLDIDMLLQVDATFLYINGKSTFELTTADLVGNESLYNTYKYKGLPPGPIASPGLDSLKAAVTPIEHDFIFYLADMSGVTHFSETYKEHLQKKRKYLGT